MLADSRQDELMKIEIHIKMLVLGLINLKFVIRLITVLKAFSFARFSETKIKSQDPPLRNGENYSIWSIASIPSIKANQSESSKTVEEHKLFGSGRSHRLA